MMPVSPNRRESKQAYTRERIPFLVEQRFCEVGPLRGDNGPACRVEAEQVHHVVNRSQCHWMEADRRVFCGICGPCHDFVTAHPAWAFDNGVQFRAFEWFPYEPVSCRHDVDGHVWVMIEQGDEATLHREEWIMAVSVGLITPKHPYDAIGHSNERRRDNRLANFFVRYGPEEPAA